MCGSYSLLLNPLVAISVGRNRSVLSFLALLNLKVLLNQWVVSHGYFPPVNMTNFVGETLVAPVCQKQLEKCVSV